MNAGKVKTFKHLGLYDTLYRNKTLGRKFLEKISTEWPNLGTKLRSPYGNSFFGHSLYHIQLLKNVYGIRKRSFLKQLTFKSKSKRGTKSTNLLNLLENKLDYFLFNSGYVKTLCRAKELIESGQIKVNGELVKSSGYILKSTDKVSLRGNNPAVIGETKYNVVSNFSMTTQWSFYTELLEDTMLLKASGERGVSFEHQLKNAEFNVLHSEICVLKDLVSQSLDVLSLPETDFIELKKELVSRKKTHFGVFLESGVVSKKYLGTISMLLKRNRDVLENKNVRAQRYLAQSYFCNGSFEGLERYITSSLLFSDLSLLKPTWEDCVDQNTSDLSTELTVLPLGFEIKSVNNETYTSSYFSDNIESKALEFAEVGEDSVDSLFATPQDEELDLAEELEEIRENADYYSQLEIEVVENRAPYIESYTNTRNLYCQYAQSIFLNSTPLGTDKNICKNCSCDMENHVVLEGSIETRNDSPADLVTASDLFLISEYYTALLFLENEELFENSALSTNSMAQSVILRDKKEGTRFNLVARSPEVTGEGFYLDPELWELRSRVLEDFSESKIDSAEHVIKATR